MAETGTTPKLTPRRAIEQMAAYVPPTASRHGKLRLDFNENTVGCSPRVVRLLRKVATRELLSIYPEYQQAREKLGAFLGVEADQVLFTNGTDEGIHALCNTYVDPGDEVIMPWPTFPMFRFYVEVVGGRPRRIAYRSPDLAFPLEEILEAITPATKAVLIANPNNPTGGAIGLGEIQKILERAEHAAILIDEAYFEFYRVTALELLPRYPNLFVSRTFSKTYGLAGLRVGCLLSQAENIRSMRKGQSPYSINSLGILCALEAIEDQEYLSAYVAEVLKARERFCRGLRRLGVPYYPSEANFVLATFGEQAAAVCARLREKGILVRDRSAELPGTVRITVGKLKQMRTLLTALEEVLAS